MAFHCIVYFGCQLLQPHPRTVGGEIDKKIPLVPGFIYIYASWFFLLMGVPMLLCYRDPVTMLRFLAAWMLDIAISDVIFVAFPTTFQRPEPPKGGPTGFMFKTIYGGNIRFRDCAPSVHCSVSMLIFAAMVTAAGVPLAVRAGICVLSLLIVASTVLVKQHVLLDVLTAVPAAALCWLLTGLLPLEKIAAALGLI